MYRVVVVALLLTLCHGFTLDRWLEENKMKVEQEGGKIWVLLIAGSRGYYNYRHQADICHAYHIVRGHGIPQENIVTMMADDIAFNKENPTPGKIINAVGGPNVYEGVIKDYTHLDVTPQNFLNILTGDAEEMQGIGSGKVIASEAGDYVFVNFADHGESGGIAFPNDDILHASDLFRDLKNMYQQKKYSQMLLYIEACYAGSMFENILPETMNITAHTAANAHESSYACTYSEIYGTYLGDCWSLNWMNDTDACVDLSKETVGEQYLAVKADTNTSHVSIYGDVSIIYNEPISTFMGAKKSFVLNQGEINFSDAVQSQDVMVESYKRQWAASTSEWEMNELKKKIEYHTVMETVVQELMAKVTLFVVDDDETTAESVIDDTTRAISDFECNAVALNAFHDYCFKVSAHPYITKYTYILSNLCGIASSDKIKEAFNEYCPIEE